MSHEFPNYTQIPNIFFDELLPILGLAEMKVLLTIYRKIFGWHKKRDRISLSQLEELTGLERTHITKAIESLLEKNLIVKEVEGISGNQQTFYEVSFKEINTSVSTPPPQCQKDTPPSVVKTPTKETLTKETNTKEKREEKKEFSLLFYSKNEYEEIRKALEKEGHSNDHISNTFTYASKDHFWLKTINSPESFIRNFKTMMGQAPKLKKEMSDVELFQEMVRRITKEEPLSAGHIQIDKDRKVITETHYLRTYPFEIGVDVIYKRIMESYGKTTNPSNP